MKTIVLSLGALLTSMLVSAQNAPLDEAAGRAYGSAVTKAVLLAETLIFMEKKCPNLVPGPEYRKLLAEDRKRVEAGFPMLARLVEILVPSTTEQLVEALGGCTNEKLKDRHTKMKEDLALDIIGLMQGSWMSRK